MSLTVKFELKGLAEAKAALKQLPDKLGKRVMQQAARKAANVVLHAARAAAPVDTGNLRKHIKVKALRPMNNQVFTMIIGVEAGYHPRELNQKAGRGKAGISAQMRANKAVRRLKTGKIQRAMNAHAALKGFYGL